MRTQSPVPGPANHPAVQPGGRPAAPGALALVYISRSGGERFGLAMDALGRHYPFAGSAKELERLMRRAYVGLPVAVNHHRGTSQPPSTMHVSVALTGRPVAGPP